VLVGILPVRVVILVAAVVACLPSSEVEAARDAMSHVQALFSRAICRLLREHIQRQDALLSARAVHVFMELTKSLTPDLDAQVCAIYTLFSVLVCQRACIYSVTR
jgi:hypothetical protein